MIPQSKCIECELLLWDDTPELQPNEGDLCVCIFCGTINQFDKELHLIQPTSITKESKEASKHVKKMNATLAKDMLEKIYKTVIQKRDISSQVEEQI